MNSQSSLWKERALLSVADLPLFGFGFVVSFLAAWMCVRWLLRYIATHDFTPFAWYRIAFGTRRAGDGLDGGGQLGGLIDLPSLRGVVETHRFYNF